MRDYELYLGLLWVDQSRSARPGCKNGEMQQKISDNREISASVRCGDAQRLGAGSNDTTVVAVMYRDDERARATRIHVHLIPDLRAGYVPKSRSYVEPFVGSKLSR
jgi:hypothetical protein